jgi:hypothetical protein
MPNMPDMLDLPDTLHMSGAAGAARWGNRLREFGSEDTW